MKITTMRLLRFRLVSASIDNHFKAIPKHRQAWRECTDPTCEADRAIIDEAEKQVKKGAR